MARAHVASRPGGIATLRSRLPQIMAELPIRSHEVAMQIAESTAEGATQRAASQYQGDFNIEAEEISGEGTEFRGGQERAGKWITGWTIQIGHEGHLLTGKAAGIYADWYWFFGEFGTTGQPARPFMVPALEQAFSEIHDNAEEAFDKL